MAQPTWQFHAAFSTINPFAASPTWTDLSDRLGSFSWNRGRQRAYEICGPGSATFTLDNSDRALEPLYTSSPYYPNVVTGVQVRLQASITGYGVVGCFRGYINRITPHWETPVDQTVTWECTDAMAMFPQWPITTVLWVQQTMAQRANAILDAIGWPTAQRSIGVNASQVPRLDPANTYDPAELFGKLSDSWPASVYIDGGGRVVVSPVIIAAGTTLGQGGTSAFSLGPNGIDYETAEPVADETQVATKVTVTREVNPAVTGDKPVPQSSQVADTGRHGRRTLDKTIWALTDATAASRASTLLAYFKNPIETFDPVGLVPRTNAEYNTVLGYEIGTKGTMDRTSDNGTYTAEVLLNYLSHDVVKYDTWTTTLRLAGRQIP